MSKNKSKSKKLHLDTVDCAKKMYGHFDKEMRRTVIKAIEARQMLRDKFGKHIVQLF